MVQLIRLIVRQPSVFLQQSIISLLYALPFVFGLLLAAAGASIELALDALKFALGRIPEKADSLCDELTRRAIIEGFPYLWEIQLRNCFHGFAVLVIVGTWLLMLFLISFLLSLLF
jgi:hypothetical protein